MLRNARKWGLSWIRFKTWVMNELGQYLSALHWKKLQSYKENNPTANIIFQMAYCMCKLLFNKTLLPMVCMFLKVHPVYPVIINHIRSTV